MEEKANTLSSMNRLTREDRARILHLLCEGQSIRAVTRLTGASKNTVTKLVVDAGRACAGYQDRVLRNLPCKRVQVDEIWNFVYAKQANVGGAKRAPANAGDVWTWTAICADTKLLCTWLIGARDAECAETFMLDLRDRLANRVQLTSDGHRPYLTAVHSAFGADIDYAMLVKLYGADPAGEKRYSPAKCIGARKTRIMGNPDHSKISTSYAERQNLTMRMHMRRFTRLTNAFSKKVENHAYAVALHAMYYNFVRIHQTLKVSPAMAAGVTKKLWEMTDIVAMLEDWEAERARVKAVFEVREAVIGGTPYVQITMPDGTSDQIYGFDSRDAASEWIEIERRGWLRKARH
jgi:IS1 family transposase